MKKLFTSLMAAFAFIALIGMTQPANASCGCDKPSPAPADIIPHVGFQNSVVHIYDSQLVAGGTWQVTLTVGGANFSSNVQVVTVKDITDVNGQTYTPVIPFTIPYTGLKYGPAQITATCAGKNPITVPSSAFTVIGTPITLGENTGIATYSNKKTGVGSDGTLYYVFNGLDAVTDEMEYRGDITNSHLLFDENDVVTFNSQGFIIDPSSANPAHFDVLSPISGSSSNALKYNRHAFDAYYTDHLPNHIKEVDPNHPDWHKNASQGHHVEYNYIIVAINGKINGYTPLSPGVFTGTVKVTSTNTD